ncbi:hypothetical protein BU25DRAFT_382010 [Macroventuria anomochaeta]|uniref:Uncharacterized protein n=1 Tax=Macroventuria anomochaeta TaxID=301207 RepID=A0ACB6SGR8_9PLEO|nr:uncharacterized protein BU25DRAFT_382010 [Macroventuria anomochaeta]KAF2632519.1 hypothetical protein BU25DRAFT_382010 [Macroventuria anomochaeta]
MLHLLACVRRTQEHVTLLQECIDEVKDNLSLFLFMKQSSTQGRDMGTRSPSLRPVVLYKVRLFRLRVRNTDEVPDHNPCCMSSTPSVCECIPPGPKVEPAPDAEYRCKPAGSPATWPLVLSAGLVHMLSSPQCINEQETWVLDLLPKRTRGQLQERAGQPVEGCGIYYQEGVDFDVIISVVFGVFILASLLFGVYKVGIRHPGCFRCQLVYGCGEWDLYGLAC